VTKPNGGGPGSTRSAPQAPKPGLGLPVTCRRWPPSTMSNGPLKPSRSSSGVPSPSPPGRLISDDAVHAWRVSPAATAAARSAASASAHTRDKATLSRVDRASVQCNQRFTLSRFLIRGKIGRLASAAAIAKPFSSVITTGRSRSMQLGRFRTMGRSSQRP
jgi:hypothetical protein